MGGRWEGWCGGCQGWEGGGGDFVWENYEGVAEEMKFTVLMTNYGSFQ